MRSKDARKARAVTRRANVKHGRLRRMVDYSTRIPYDNVWLRWADYVKMLNKYQPMPTYNANESYWYDTY